MSLQSRLNKIESLAIHAWQQDWLSYDTVVWDQLPGSTSEYLHEVFGISDQDFGEVNKVLSHWDQSDNLSSSDYEEWIDWQDRFWSVLPYQGGMLDPDFSKRSEMIPYPPVEPEGYWGLAAKHLQEGSHHEKIAAAWVLYQLSWARAIRTLRSDASSREKTALFPH